MVNDLSEEMGLSEDMAAAMLINHAWDARLAKEKFFEDPDFI